MPRKQHRFFKLILLIQFLVSFGGYAQEKPGIIQLVYTSDPHYGISRSKFKGDSAVRSAVVLNEMVRQINRLPGVKIPEDSGVSAGNRISSVDFVIVTGDIANRTDGKYQSASRSWDEFSKGFLKEITLKNSNGLPVDVLLSPGNHDISNAIGHFKISEADKDPVSMVNIYNRMIHPGQLLSTSSYEYSKHKIHYFRDVKGVRLMFVNLWPDSAERVWMKHALARTERSKPVLLFCHDQPDIEAGHFLNPVAPYQSNVETKFENLTTERYKDGISAASKESNSVIEQRALAKFLSGYPNIRAYFHGNDNYNEFYTYRGPDSNINLNVFRVDSPMKGKFSKKDESRLSFQLISIDTIALKMTVRECLWNQPGNEDVTFGEAKTISLRPWQ